MYLGNVPAQSYTAYTKQDFTTSATTSYTLDYPVANENEIALFINFVRQEPTTAYTASGTTLTLTSATSASDDMYCVFLGKALQTVNPPAGSVGLSQLSATGTASASTYLRGDNSWGAISVGDNTPAFFVSLSADQSISGASTETQVQFNTELFDTDNCYDNSTNYRFTPTTAGKYALFTSVNVFTSSGDWNGYYVEINKNGTRIALSTANYYVNVIGGGNSMTIPVHAIADANGSTDYFDVYFSCNNANGKANGDSNTFTNFYGYKLNGV